MLTIVNKKLLNDVVIAVVLYMCLFGCVIAVIVKCSPLSTKQLFNDVVIAVVLLYLLFFSPHCCCPQLLTLINKTIVE